MDDSARRPHAWSETGTPDIASGSADGLLSPLPTPDGDDVPRPSGDPGNLTVLDWAGFESAVSYTFDDGDPSQIDHYDAIRGTGIDATFYLSANVDFPGFENGWRRVAEDGHELGNHTVSHPSADLTGSSFGAPRRSTAAEIGGCTDYVTRTLRQRDVWTMAAPFGETGWSEPAREADVFVNRGVGGGTIAPNDDTDPFDLPCYLANEGDTAETFAERIDSSRSDGEWLVFLFHSLAPTDAAWYAPVPIADVTASIDHAKSFGDVWLDTVVNIGAYWLGQRLVDSTTPTTSGDETTWRWTLPDGFPDGRYLRVSVDGGTLTQGGDVLEWDPHGYYEVSLDERSLTLSPSFDGTRETKSGDGRATDDGTSGTT